MAKTICVLSGPDARAAFGRWSACSHHTHASSGEAGKMVEAGMAEWVSAPAGFAGNKRSVTVKMIRMLQARTWRKTMSRDGRATVAVMQLVG